LATGNGKTENACGNGNGNPTLKFVDNKRKMMEKKLSASQRDQIYLNIARDELRLKQDIVTGLTEATKESSKAFEKVSESISTVGRAIGEGFTALANALNGMNHPAPNNFNMQGQHFMRSTTPYFGSGEHYQENTYQNL